MSQVMVVSPGMICGSNDFQDYFDDDKESRVKQVPKNQESKSFKNQDSRLKRRLNQDKYRKSFSKH